MSARRKRASTLKLEQESSNAKAEWKNWNFYLGCAWVIESILLQTIYTRPVNHLDCLSLLANALLNLQLKHWGALEAKSHSMGFMILCSSRQSSTLKFRSSSSQKKTNSPELRVWNRHFRIPNYRERSLSTNVSWGHRSHNFFCKRTFQPTSIPYLPSVGSLLLKAAKGEQITLDIENLEASHQEDINVGLLITELLTFIVQMT